MELKSNGQVPTQTNEIIISGDETQASMLLGTPQVMPLSSQGLRPLLQTSYLFLEILFD